MVRLLNVDIPDNKNIDISLTYIYGIGLSLAKQILKEAKIDSTKKTKDLTSEELNRIREIIEEKNITTKMS